MSFKLNIYSYDNYRKILSDFYSLAKKENPSKISYRYFSKLAGFSAPSFLYLVIQGKRNLGFQSIGKLTNIMGLSSREALFFQNLVGFNQAKNVHEKTEYFEELKKFREYTESMHLDEHQYQYYAYWYYPIIRELTNLDDFCEDPLWIVKNIQPSISREDAKRALDFLIESNLLSRDDDGRLRPTHNSIKSNDEISSLAIAQFHDRMILQGRESLKNPSFSREVSSVTMSISKKQFGLVIEKMRKFHDEIQEIVQQDQGKIDRVCQLNMQLFHLTKINR